MVRQYYKIACCCIKQIASGKLLYSTGSSTLCSVMTLWGGMAGMGGRSKRKGIYVYKYLIDFVGQQKLHNIVKTAIPLIK